MNQFMAASYMQGMHNQTAPKKTFRFATISPLSTLHTKTKPNVKSAWKMQQKVKNNGALWEGML